MSEKSVNKHWAYVHTAQIWTAWLYIDGLVVEKLGNFNTKQEAIEAKNRFEQETENEY